FGSPKMVHQQVSRHSRNPGCKGPFLQVKSLQRMVDLDKHLLAQVLGIRARTCKPVTDVIDSLSMFADEFLPGCCVSSDTAPYEGSCQRTFFQPTLLDSCLNTSSGTQFSAQKFIIFCGLARIVAGARRTASFRGKSVWSLRIVRLQSRWTEAAVFLLAASKGQIGRRCGNSRRDRNCGRGLLLRWTAAWCSS